MPHEILIGLGGNLPSGAGAPIDTLRAALRELQERGLTLKAVSRAYCTTPVPPSGQPDFVNAVAAFETTLSPDECLDILKTVETALGRQRGERWSARTLDLDLLAAGDTVAPDATTWRHLAFEADPMAVHEPLVLPHPRLHGRGFVLMPLMDIAPGWLHPVTGETVAAMAAACEKAGGFEGVRPIGALLGKGASL
ncbi:2-amino-4-hydroxy-6-hydroxymethyldihydropteridine diphosphokinase [Gimibacter soli]|uniref:2-amino-4-hydroxy-6-hydroxymethyldihydropteridine pyrophosphokinase n=1 Tax=Gimibacter soli TaxID=3024400 RepID=A0AAE9XR84_9PROT|nr:2-amino-4-hydroxy-6-hydroxymethyldihydropteridine diphosphokinase [Gimibacter soli]WCL55737.1 2-amino-4-hydroxy-6-hydroxymethyldihydropteridine diphosphokinase [Gimibacter soli]